MKETRTTRIIRLRLHRGRPSHHQQQQQQACKVHQRTVMKMPLHQPHFLMTLYLIISFGCCCLPRMANAWGGGGSDVDTTIYGDSLSRDWLSSGSTISLKIEGCLWGVTENNEDMGCLEDSSNDGTEYWYRMANCRRAQVVYSLYQGSGCSNFKESFVTMNGLAEFVYYVQKYSNGNSQNGNDDGTDDSSGSYTDFDDLPNCAQSNGNYVGLGCNEDGTFAVMYFSDEYCMKPTGAVYDKLRSINRQLRTYKNCATIYKNGNSATDNGVTLPAALVQLSEPCSSIESSLCTDSSTIKSRLSHTTKAHSKLSVLNMPSLGQKNWVPKLKYVTAGAMLLASFVMFTGILFTNRRRRRALMQRKYRQSKPKPSASRKSKSGSSATRSKSKTRSGGRSPTKSPPRRSLSRSPKAARDEAEEDSDEVKGAYSC